MKSLNLGGVTSGAHQASANSHFFLEPTATSACAGCFRPSGPSGCGLVPAPLLPLTQPTLQGTTKPSEGTVLLLLADAVDEQHPKVKLGRLTAGLRG